MDHSCRFRRDSTTTTVYCDVLVARDSVVSVVTLQLGSRTQCEAERAHANVLCSDANVLYSDEHRQLRYCGTRIAALGYDGGKT